MKSEIKERQVESLDEEKFVTRAEKGLRRTLFNRARTGDKRTIDALKNLYDVTIWTYEDAAKGATR